MTKTSSRKKAAEIKNRLAEVRAQRGLAAADLAREAAVTRQTIYAIEAGRYMPNTALGLRLAKALRVPLEQLFCLSEEPGGGDLQRAILHPMAKDLQDGQAVQLSQVNGKLIATGSDPQSLYLPESDGTIAGRNGGQGVRLALHGPQHDLSNRLLWAGCDPAMQLLANYVRPSGLELVLIQQNSSRSLSSLKHGFAHIAGSHLREENSGDSNVSAVHRLFPAKSVALVTFAFWEEGFVIAGGNPKNIRTAEDLARKNVTFVNREEGSGSRLLVDGYLKRLDLQGSQVRGYEQTAAGHLAAAWDVKVGKADCSISTEACARSLGLSFVPLETVRYELVVRKKDWGLPALQSFFDSLSQLAFRKKLASLGGYDTSATGQWRE